MTRPDEIPALSQIRHLAGYLNGLAAGCVYRTHSPRESGDLAVVLRWAADQVEELVELQCVTMAAVDLLASIVTTDDQADYLAEIASRIESKLRRLGVRIETIREAQQRLSPPDQ